MRPRITLIVAVVFLLAGMRTAWAQVPVSVTFDEFNAGTVSLPGGVVPLLPAPGTPDPQLAPGFAPTPVIYSLIAAGLAPVSNGDILVQEIPGDSQSPSDLLRFFDNALFVYSDVSPGDPADAPADVGVPPVSTLFPVLVMPETGPEAGPNGLFGYIPLSPADPGFSGAVPGGVSYTFISDREVPEPASLGAIAVAAALATTRGRRREAIH